MNAVIDKFETFTACYVEMIVSFLEVILFSRKFPNDSKINVGPFFFSHKGHPPHLQTQLQDSSRPTFSCISFSPFTFPGVPYRKVFYKVYKIYMGKFHIEIVSTISNVFNLIFFFGGGAKDTLAPQFFRFGGGA